MERIPCPVVGTNAFFDPDVIVIGFREEFLTKGIKPVAFRDFLAWAKQPHVMGVGVLGQITSVPHDCDGNGTAGIIG